MSVVPRTVSELLTFCTEHEDVWNAAPPTAIGLTAAQLTAYGLILKDASDAVAAQGAAISAAKAATTNANSRVKLLRASVADLLRYIRAYAESQANPATVYAAAQIPPPAQPGPPLPPGLPVEMRASLEPDGAVTIRWKALGGASGNTVWTVTRRLPGETAYSFCGATGSRIFEDDSLPSGSSGVSYMIQGRRGTAVGPSSIPFNVVFGTGGGGLTIASQFSGDAKMAA